MKEKVLFSWSGGKDSAMALHEFSKNGDYEISAILTTVTECYQRISMHGVRQELLELQAKYLGLPLEKILITQNATNEEYASKMEALLKRYKTTGVSSVVFGDIFLEDLKRYRESNLAKVGMTCCFPIWKRDTAELSHTFIELGFKAIITCVDTQTLDGKFVGRVYDEQFLRELPANVDPCGENGEFHSFVYDGPIFSQPIPVETGEVVLRDNRFYFCDLVPSGEK